MDEVVKQLLKC